MRKILIFAAAGLLTTATIVYATAERKTSLKEEAKKEAVKKDVKKNTEQNKTAKRSCSWF